MTAGVVLPVRTFTWLGGGIGLVLSLGMSAALAVAALAAAEMPVPEEHVEFFERQVRPLLVEHCFACHAKGQKKGGLSLESRAAVLAGGESGAVVVLGKPAESLLVQAVGYGESVQMPPSARLTDTEVAVFRQWVQLGLPWGREGKSAGDGGGIRESGEITAADRDFWSFRRPERAARPALQQPGWSRSPLDDWVQATHERQGLRPVGDADRRTLARRMSLTLTGLPLDEDTWETLAADEGPDALARQVDRWLASPRYGERWGRHWLDVARFGEDQAHTFQARMYPEGYRYRDWVVGSLNRDLPYDVFLQQQIAGDLLAGPEMREQLPALGFFALGPVYYADAGCAPKALADEWDDRVDTLCRGVLGLTVACARCHDHKFDPITRQDYYALAGIFASSRYEELPLVEPAVVERYNAAQAAVKEQEKTVNEERNRESRRLAEEMVPSTARYLVAAWTVQQRRRVAPQTPVAVVAQESGLVEGALEAWIKFLGSDQLPRRALFASWREKLAGLDAARDLSADPAVKATVEELAAAIQERLRGALERRRELDAAHAAALAAAADDAARAKVARPQLEKEHAELLKEWLEDDKSPLVPPKDKLESLVSAEVRQQLMASREELDRRKQAVGAKYPFAHGLAEAEGKNLKIHLRGDHRQLGDEAPRRFLAILSPETPVPVTAGSGRRELALAITSRDNPLTARVLVNRVWQQHFGRGLVSTPSNFGLLGARPTHPELLDELALRFQEAGWSLKWLQRDILLSRTYGLSAARTAENQTRDPDNRWLWRASRRRLDVEAWRDSLLSISGELDLALGGPGLDLTTAQHRRRTLYSKVSRHDLHPMLRLFDFPDPNLTSEQRVVTTVPLQQLFVLNSDYLVRPARELAARSERAASGDDGERVRWIYRRAFSREPTLEEQTLARAFLEGSRSADSKLPPWVQYCQAILATNELQFVD
ncbi:MAG: PSD1 and planctomycete cytochrome C domain-containing protein [Pirellulales bacterium]